MKKIIIITDNINKFGKELDILNLVLDLENMNSIIKNLSKWIFEHFMLFFIDTDSKKLL